MWPWKRSASNEIRDEVEAAREQVHAAARDEQAAEERHRDALKLIAQARTVSAGIRHELGKNHFTELMTQAMEARG